MAGAGFTGGRCRIMMYYKRFAGENRIGEKKEYLIDWLSVDYCVRRVQRVGDNFRISSI